MLLAKIQSCLPVNANKMFPLHKIGLLVGSTAVVQVINFCITPFLTRMFTPEQFGTLAIYVSSLGIIGTVIGLRYEVGIPVPEHDEDGILLTVFSLFVVGIFFLCLLLISLSLYSTQALSPRFDTILLLIPLGSLFLGVLQVLNYFAIRKKSYDFIATAKFKQGIGATTLQLVFGLLSLKSIGLVLGHMFGQLFGLLGFLKILAQDLHLFRQSLTVAKLLSIGRKYRAYPIYSATASLFNSSGVYLPSLLLVYFFGVEVGGYFALTQKVLSLPLVTLGTALGQVYLGESSKLEHAGKDRQTVLFMYLTKLLLILMVPIAIVLSFSNSLFAQFFGETWRTSGSYALILLPAMLLQLLTNPLSQIIFVKKKQKTQLVLDIFRAVLVSFSIYIPYKLHLSVNEALISYSCVMSIIYAVSYICYLNVSRSESAS